MTAINRIFLGFMIVAGLAAGAALAARPELRDLRVPPYFWILIAMLLFELAAFARGSGVPGSYDHDGNPSARIRARGRVDDRHSGRCRLARTFVLGPHWAAVRHG
jgi:hypothetical protein